MVLKFIIKAVVGAYQATSMILKAFIKIYCMIPIKFRASCIPCDKVIKATTQVAVDY